jgi:adenine phosphoribosyltransferase
MSTSLADRIRSGVRDIPDFPTPGILFRDITPVLADPALFGGVVEHFRARFEAVRPEVIVAIESRGFIVGAPLALALGTAFAPIRKPGKLPWQTIRTEYALEYGSDALEAHVDAIRPGQRVLVIDDVLATGGTASAAVGLVRRLGGDVVACGFVIELGPLRGRDRLPDLTTESILIYP